MKIPDPYEGPVVALMLGAGGFAVLGFMELVAWLT